jgi:hypothetical protein
MSLTDGDSVPLRPVAEVVAIAGSKLIVLAVDVAMPAERLSLASLADSYLYNMSFVSRSAKSIMQKMLKTSMPTAKPRASSNFRLISTSTSISHKYCAPFHNRD